MISCNDSGNYRFTRVDIAEKVFTLQPSKRLVFYLTGRVHFPVEFLMKLKVRLQ